MVSKHLQYMAIFRVDDRVRESGYPHAYADFLGSAKHRFQLDVLWLYLTVRQWSWN